MDKIDVIGKCSCPPDSCEQRVSPPEACIKRLDGEVISQPCPVCKANTWHQNGECVRCRLQEKDKELYVDGIDQRARRRKPQIRQEATAGSLSLSIKLGDGTITVTDKKRVARILKILLLEDK